MSKTAARRQKLPEGTTRRIDRAGRLGWELKDGAILWDDGEKEVPPSGLSDDAKRQQALADAGVLPPQPTRTGPSRAEIAELEGQAIALAGNERRLAERKKLARDAASLKPGQDRPATMPVAQNDLENLVRRDAKRLLDREIDRLEELKQLAVAGHVSLVRDGILQTRNNPPLILHEVILSAIQASDSAPPVTMVRLLKDLGGWQGMTPTDEIALPSDGPPPDDTERINLATQARQPSGGEFSGLEEPPKKPDVVTPLETSLEERREAARQVAATKPKQRRAKKAS